MWFLRSTKDEKAKPTEDEAHNSLYREKVLWALATVRTLELKGSKSFLIVPSLTASFVYAGPTEYTPANVAGWVKEAEAYAKTNPVVSTKVYTDLVRECKKILLKFGFHGWSTERVYRYLVECDSAFRDKKEAVENIKLDGSALEAIRDECYKIGKANSEAGIKYVEAQIVQKLGVDGEMAAPRLWSCIIWYMNIDRS